jgi:hypothetical protein
LLARSLRSQVKTEIVLDGFQFLGKAVKIGHGPATVIGCRWDARFFFGGAIGGQAESQGTYPNWSKLTLSARESVARRLALFARLFYCAREYFGGD